MASTLTLVKRATALATSGLAGIEKKDDLISYDDLVKAKGILDLIVELPSFEVEIGKYLASVELCSSILARSINLRRRRLNLEKSARRARAQRSPSLLRSPSSGKGSFEREKRSLAGVRATAGPQAPSLGTAPTACDRDDTLTFDSIVGNSAAKRALFEHVVLPLKLSEGARSSIFAGIRSSGNNVLLHGPPGTGKTTIAQAASREAGAAFYSVTPSSILSKYQGESERVLHQLFDDAKKTKPSIIFLDELDALAPSRDAQDDVQSRRLLAEILLQTSQLRPKDQVVIIAATNRMDDVDVALLRRFHSRIFVGPPSHKERVEMIMSFMDGIEHSLGRKETASLADRTPGWSGSDIQCLCREACMGPVRSLYEQESDLERVFEEHPPGGEAVMLRPVHMSDWDAAYSTLMGSSAMVGSDQGLTITDELVNNELENSLGGQTTKLESTHMETGTGEGRPCAERESKDSAKETTSRRGR